MTNHNLLMEEDITMSFGPDSGSRPTGGAQSTLVSSKAFDPGQEAEVDMTVHSLWMDAGYLSVAPRPMLTRNRDLIVEARERLNDALARIGA